MSTVQCRTEHEGTLSRVRHAAVVVFRVQPRSEPIWVRPRDAVPAGWHLAPSNHQFARPPLPIQPSSRRTETVVPTAPFSMGRSLIMGSRGRRPGVLTEDEMTTVRVAFSFPGRLVTRCYSIASCDMGSWPGPRASPAESRSQHPTSSNGRTTVRAINKVPIVFASSGGTRMHRRRPRTSSTPFAPGGA